MGILANTVSICQFRVAGEFPAGDLFEWAAERLARNAFRNIDQSGDELSVGWVHLDDHRAADFPDDSVCRRDHYLVFSLRRDQRRIPAALYRAYLQRAEEEFLAGRPELQRVPKAKREELREAVRGMLLSRTLPVPSSWDAVWDTRSGLVSFTSLTPKVIEQFEGLFKQTFEGLRLIAVHPYARAEQVVPETLREALAKANRAGSDAVVDLVRDNQWLGGDLLLWLMERTMNGSGDYAVCRPGPALDGEGFVAYLNDRMILQGQGENGVQKVTVTGPQDQFGEVRSALQTGKQMHEAVVFLEKGEHLWKLNLKGGTFQFASFKAPGVKLERDEQTDPESEKQAVFYERMYVLEEGLQLFDSLFAIFLGERLSPYWAEREGEIRAWLEE